MKIIMTVLSLFLLQTSALALSKDEIENTLEQKVKEATEVLKDDSLSTEAQAEKLFSMFDPVFNYALMARLSLGKHWNSLDSEQQEVFAKKFEKKLKNSYIDTLTQYEDEKVEFVSLKQPKSNRLYLTSEIHSGDEVYEVVYKFYQADKDDWLIYDLNIIDVSIIQSFRNQFSAYENDGFEKLLSLLEENSI
ncbi:MAG: ABC transporter substrate-binding protein [Campylobacterota bacterium]